MITTAELNKVAELIGTTDKNVVFGAILKTLFEAGINADMAFDHVFGTGSYEKFAGDLYETLCNK